LILLLTGLNAFCQDLITDKDGTVYRGTILSISPQLVHFTNIQTSRNDSLVTENLAEIATADKRRILVFSASETAEKELVGETEFLSYLQAKNSRKLLGTRTSLQSVGFYTGRYLLTLDAQKQLASLAALLLANGVNQMVIEVYADAAGNTPGNLDLASKRAQAIKEFLTDKGVKSTYISASGKEPESGTGTELISPRVALNVSGIEGMEILRSEKYIAPSPPQEQRPVSIADTAPINTSPMAASSPEPTEGKRTKTAKGKTPKLDKQKTSTFIADDRTLTVQLTLGALTTYPLGKSLDRTREYYGGEAQLNDSINTFRNSIWPSVFVSGGFEVRYLVRPGWWVAGGLRYARQGFTIRKDYEYSDPLFQYDEVFKSRTIYQINSLEVPVYIQRQLGERLSIGLGATITAAVSKRQQRIVFSKKVIINGKNSKQDAVRNQEHVNDISEYTRSMTPTALLNVNYRYTQHWGMQFRGQFSLNQYKENAQVYNSSAYLGLTYLF
ncbi:MAG: OmpA family protein, partial [Bacteroidetes bacterium]|nr:OmpA family protein [Bacteroidota bacterium]